MGPRGHTGQRWRASPSVTGRGRYFKTQRASTYPHNTTTMSADQIIYVSSTSGTSDGSLSPASRTTANHPRDTFSDLSSHGDSSAWGLLTPPRGSSHSDEHMAALHAGSTPPTNHSVPTALSVMPVQAHGALDGHHKSLTNMPIASSSSSSSASTTQTSSGTGELTGTDVEEILSQDEAMLMSDQQLERLKRDGPAGLKYDTVGPISYVQVETDASGGRSKVSATGPISGPVVAMSLSEFNAMAIGTETVAAERDALRQAQASAIDQVMVLARCMSAIVHA